MSQPTLTIITPPRGWQALNVAELWQYRDLLWVWTRSQISARYKQSILGVLWAVINPLVNMLIYTLVFNALARFPSGDAPYALFVFCGLVPWTLFQTTAISAMYSLTNNVGIIKKVYFPRLILVLVSACVSLFDFIFYFLILLLFLFIHAISTPHPFIFAQSLVATTAFIPPPPFVVHLTQGILLVPVFLLQTVSFSLGVGLLFGAFDAQFRDAGRILNVLINIGFWATPIIYATSQIQLLGGVVNVVNPMALVVEGFRWAFLGLAPPPASWMLSSLVAAGVFLFGAFYFKRVETHLMDVI